MRDLIIADTAVIGGGLLGLACARRLATSGSRVVVLESGTCLVPQSSATFATAGSARLQGRDRVMLTLARYGVAAWTRLSVELGEDVGYRQTGLVMLTEDARRVPELQRRVEAERAGGIDVRLVSRDDMRVLIPALRDGFAVGTFCASDGHVDVHRATSALASAAVRDGAKVRTRAPVETIEVHGGAVAGLVAGVHRVACDNVVVAAGAWTADLLRMIGIEIAIFPHSQQILRTSSIPPLLAYALFAVDRLIGVRQLANGQVQIAGGRPGKMSANGRRARPDRAEVSRTIADAAGIVPALAGVTAATAVAGIEGYTPDGRPYVGTPAGVGGIVVAAGFSGSGVVHAIGVAELVHSLLTRATPAVDLSPFALERSPELVQPAP